MEGRFGEFLIIFVLALIVLGPEKLPRVVAEVGRWVGRARSMARQFREQLEEEVRLEEVRKSQAARTQSSSPPSGEGCTMAQPGGVPPVDVGAAMNPPPGAAHPSPDASPASYPPEAEPFQPTSTADFLIPPPAVDPTRAPGPASAKPHQVPSTPAQQPVTGENAQP
jgi:sec-independent protein translocase protein TatB